MNYPMIIVYTLLANIFADLIFVELEDQNLHILYRDSFKEIGMINIKHITNSSFNTIDLDFHDDLQKNRLLPCNSNVENIARSNIESSKNITISPYKKLLNMEETSLEAKEEARHKKYIAFSEIFGDIESAANNKAGLEVLSIIDSIYINNEGNFFFLKGKKCIDMKINIQDILDGIKIAYDCMFLGSKENSVFVIHGVTIFLARIKIKILDTLAYRKRALEITYIHYHFISSCNDISILGPFCIKSVNSLKIKTFPRKIVNIYETKKYRTGIYLSKIYKNSNINTYYPKNKQSRKIYAISMALLGVLGFFFAFKSNKKLKITKIIYEMKGYKISEGNFDKRKVIVKIYKKGDRRIQRELDFLMNNYTGNLSRYIYKESYIWATYLVFEYTFSIEDVEILGKKKFCFSIISVLDFLHSKNLTYYNLAPINIRVDYLNQPILTNFEDVNSNNRSCLGTKDWRSPEIILQEFGTLEINDEMRSKCDIFSLGLILYYIEYREHLFSTESNFEAEDIYIDTEHISFQCIKSTKKEISCNKSEILPDKEIYSADNYKRIDSFSVCSDFVSPNANIKKSSTFYIDSSEFKISDIEQNILSGDSKIFKINEPNFYNLVNNTARREYRDRYDIKVVLKHPYFWDNSRVFNFLANLSDLIENKGLQGLVLSRRLERNKHKVFRNTWTQNISAIIVENLCLNRVYNFNSIQGLIRAFRNKGRHYKELPDSVKEIYQSFPNGFVDYYKTKFPRLLMVCYISASCVSTDESLSDFYPGRK